MYSVERQVRDFLAIKGVETFWIDSAVTYIRQGLATNSYFPMHVINHTATVERGRVKRYSAKVRVRYPDTASEGIISLRYTCDPTRMAAHKVRVTLA